MYWILGIAAAVLGGLYWVGSQKHGTGLPIPPPGVLPDQPPAPTAPKRTPQNVAPFAAGAPVATYNYDTTNVPSGVTMHVGETLTLTVPYTPGTGYGWTDAINDSASGTDDGQSAVYPFGSMQPGLASQGLGIVPSGEVGYASTQTWGFTAIKPGTTALILTQSPPGQPGVVTKQLTVSVNVVP